MSEGELVMRCRHLFLLSMTTSVDDEPEVLLFETHRGVLLNETLHWTVHNNESSKEKLSV